MANTLHGPYVKTTWTGGSTALGATNMNHLETGASVALASLNPDLIGAGFVLSGVTCAKDGTIANQLDVALGEAYLIQTDGTLARCDVAATTFTTITPSSTYILDLNPDGSWSWATSPSGVTNHLPICNATTDGSGNILVVTDLRPLNIALLPNAAGTVTLPHGFAPAGPLTSLGGQASAGSLGAPVIVAQAVNVAVTVTTQQTILTYTPSVTGLYRINCAFVAHNGGIDKPNIGYSYTGGNTGLSTAPNQTLPGGTILNGTNTVSDNVEYHTTPQTFYAAAAAIVCIYQNNAGTPSDHITFLIERLT